jgi:hypothetical protein
METNSGIYITATTALLAIRGAFHHGNPKQVFKRKFLLWINVILFSPFILYVAADMLQFTSIYMVFMPIMVVFSDINISIRELIGYLFM